MHASLAYYYTCTAEYHGRSGNTAAFCQLILPLCMQHANVYVCSEFHRCLRDSGLLPCAVTWWNYLRTYVSVCSSLHQRLNRLLQSLVERKLVLGCQVAVCYEGEMIVDAAIGQMGPVDTRPVTPDSLFCGYCTAKGDIEHTFFSDGRYSFGIEGPSNVFFHPRKRSISSDSSCATHVTVRQDS